MKKVLDCPYCDGHAKINKQEKEISYRKEVFKTIEHFYKCGKCKEEFTTTETDTVTMLQIHNQYREKYSIPFTEEIVELRTRYDLSASKMSEVLGLGINGYSNYEKGEVPTPAIGNLISTINDPIVFRGLLLKAKHYFNEGMYISALQKVEAIIDNEKEEAVCSLKINQFDEPNSLTGYKKPNKKKVANLLVAFINSGKSDFNDKLKLNKQLFYADFLSYKSSGFSITGLSYRAIQYGPVPSCYDNIYACLENEGLLISNWIKEENRSAKETFKTDNVFENQLFTKEEQSVVDIVIERFKDSATWDLVELSHKEKGWKELNNEKQLINYQRYAFDIIGV